MKLPALYELTQQHRELEQLVELDELPAEVIRDTLEGLQGTIQEKAISVAAVVRNLETHAEMVSAAAKQLRERAARAEARAESLRAYLLFNLQSVGITKITAPEFTVAVRNNPEAVNIADGAEIPAEFYVPVPPPPPRLDKTALKAALKAGREVQGVWLSSGQRVEIRS